MVVTFSHCWRRCYLFWAQVVPIVGAGEEKGWGPAPRIAVLCPVVAQVQPQKSYLRQNGERPAPGKVLTCAVMAIDLHQELKSTERCPFVISTERCPLSFRPSGSEWRNLFGGSVVNVGEIPGKAGNDIGECLRRRSK